MAEEQLVLDAIMEKPPQQAPAGRAANGQFTKGEAPPRTPAPIREPDDTPDDEEPPDEPLPDDGDEGQEDEAAQADIQEELPPEEEPSADQEDIDDYTVDVLVDGKKQEVTLKELKSKYSGSQYIEKQIQKSVEARKAVETHAENLFKANTVMMAKLNQIDSVLATIAEPQIDWERLKATDVNAYFLKRDEQREAQEKRAQLQQEARRVHAEQERLSSEAQQRYTRDEAEKLMLKMPDLADPKKGKALMGRMVTAAQHYGYTPEEVDAVIDHRAMTVLHDAMLYRELVSRRKATTGEQPSARKVMVKPSAAKPGMQTQKKRLDAQVLKRARDSGKPEDVAQTLLVRKSAR